MAGDYGPGDAPTDPGLLGNVGTWLKDPRNAAGLQAFGAALAKAGAPSRVPLGSFAGGLSEALSGFTQGREGYDQSQLMRRFQEMKMKELEAQSAQENAKAEQLKSAAQRQAAFQSLMGGNTAMQLGAQQGDIGPTQTNASRIPLDPIAALRGKATIASNAGYLDEAGKLLKEAKDFAPQVDKYEWVVGPDGKPALTALMKDASAPKTMTGLGQIADPNKPFAPGGIPNKPFQDYELGKASAGKTTVNVNTGQKGLDNELKIRSDFRSEPIYKAHSEVQSAYQQIKQGITQASPSGDLAAATKIMKLLDPTSVVRESELAMAIAAGGKFDKLAHYAQNTLSGNKLTPTQRADFMRLADGLFKESETLYNAKRNEYKDIAKQYSLNSDLITGKDDPYAGWSIKPK